MRIKAFQLETFLATVLLSASPVSSFTLGNSKTALVPQVSSMQRTRRFASSFESSSNDEAERLREMAAKLRSEAASLEAEQRAAWAQATEQAFGKFDTNKDGQISLQELQEGLEKAFKVEISEHRVKQLMQAYDTNKDGYLQPEEFVGLDQMRNKIDSLVREERALEREEQKAAQEQLARQAELEAQLDLINDKPPTATDKVVSTLPYLFPLLDGLQFSGALEHPDNLLSLLAVAAYSLYRSIPFSGLICFFALSFLADNLALNRLVRFNMRQAIYVDIALFFPSLIISIITIAAGGQSNMPPALLDLSNNVVFGALAVTLLYTTGSSLLGMMPDKLPLISQTVQNRMVSVEKVQDTFVDRNQDNERNKKD